MRILCIADTHSNFSEFEPIALPPADLCLIAGDITEYGLSDRRSVGHDWKAAWDWLAALGARQPTFVIPGNHDIGVRSSDFDGIAGVSPILGRRAEFRGLSLYGVSLCPVYAFPRWARLYDYMTIDPAEESEAFDFEPVDIVVSHCPPYSILDRIRTRKTDNEGARIGSESLLRYIEANRPRLVVCGHVHNDAGQEWVGDTLVVNTAQHASVLEIEGQPRHDNSGIGIDAA